MRKLRTLLFGPRGQLGTDFRHAAEDVLDLIPVGREMLELSNLDSVDTFLSGERFDVLVNCSSYHNTDEAESNAQLAILMNAHLIRRLARACAAKRARFVHISTDYVFGGGPQRRLLTEEDPRAPLNVYGASKALGECFAFAEAEDTLVLRVAALFGVAGSSGKGGNFVENMIGLARRQSTLRVVDDQITSPTATADVASSLVTLLRGQAPAGIYHTVNSGAASWYKLTQHLVQMVGLDVAVEPIASTELNRPAMRPPYSALNNGKLATVLNRPMRHWESALGDYLIARGHIEKARSLSA
jgi:dTDP-4-dehydrorhamnose reductase